MKKCIACNTELVGRVDKIFCDPSCKSSFHYKRNVQKEKGEYLKITEQLKFNRRVLSHFIKSGYKVVAKSTMVSVGFDPYYFTHKKTIENEGEFYFCFEYGFKETEENSIAKFILQEGSTDI